MSFLKKLSLLLALPLALTGCFDSTSSSADLAHTYTAPDSSFQISYPDTFLSVPEADLPTGILFALTDLESQSGFASNVSVASESLSEDSSSLRFALANIQKSETVLPGYTLISADEIEAGGDPTRLHLFSVDNQGQKILFAQLYLTQNQRGYVVTAAYPDTASSEKQSQILDIIRSFKLLVPSK